MYNNETDLEQKANNEQFSHTGCNLPATQECSSTLFETSQLRYDEYLKNNTMFIPTKNLVIVKKSSPKNLSADS